jgi:tRNA 2-thiouridine synthesizing protein A
MRNEKFKIKSSIDATGLFCPIPIVKLRIELENLEKGDIVELIADDPGIEEDLPNWCKETGHILIHLEKEGEIYKGYIKKGEK